MEALLHDRVLAQLIPVIGERLERVVYWCLEHEAHAEDLQDREFYLGGEVELGFSGNHRILVTWEQNAGFPDDSSLQVRGDSAFLPGGLERWGAEDTPVWVRHIGNPLGGAAVLGWNATPYLLRLEFTTGRVFIGIGHQRAFGNGDDVLVRAEEDMPALLDPETLWSSAPARG